MRGKDLNNLNSLHLSVTPVKGAGLKKLNDRKKLDSLDPGSTPITDQDSREIK